MENQLFTQQELLCLSDGILALMENYKQAQKLVTDGKTYAVLDCQLQRMKELNSKVCNMME